MAAPTYIPAGTGAGSYFVTNQAVWSYWCQTSSTTTATAATNNAVWAAWNTTAGTTANITYATTPGTQLIIPQWAAWNTVYEETQEQRLAREAAQAEAELRRAAAQRERLAARERALDLLGYCLDEEQLRSYREHGWFEVVSSKGRRWRIRARGQSGNVDLMPEIGEERVASYCAHPPGYLPDADAHLAQALTLVTDEDAFLRVANCQYRRPAPAA